MVPEGKRKGGREGEREGGREGGWEGGRKGGREGGKESDNPSCLQSAVYKQQQTSLIRELIDSLCRDGTDNTDAQISIFHVTCHVHHTATSCACDHR